MLHLNSCSLSENILSGSNPNKTASASFFVSISSTHKYDNKDIKVTISAGISSNNEIQDAWDMLDEADKALYKAKNNGRNRVELFKKEIL